MISYEHKKTHIARNEQLN